MDKVGSILSSIGALVVAVGMLVVLLRAGGLLDALSETLGGKRKRETEKKQN